MVNFSIISISTGTFPFEEEGIKFDIISGTSSGSIVATLYAVGYTTDEIYEIFKEYAKKIKLSVKLIIILAKTNIHNFDMKNVSKLFKNIIIERKFQIDGVNSGDFLYRKIM